MDITVSGITVQVDKKNIKNMHLYVKPPLGKVTVSSPVSVSDKSIESFVRINMGWIKRQQEKFAKQPRMAERQYISGETYYIWSKQFFLEFRPSNKRFLKIKGDKILLGMKSDSTTKQREKFVREEYRKILNDQLIRLVPKWESITGLKCQSWKIKYMTTKWGSCNPKAKRIWINLQIAEKPLECLEYVVLHELVHLKVKNHGVDFESMMDKYMPSWKERKDILNNLILDNYEEKNY